MHGSMWRKKEKMSLVPFICVFAYLYTESICSLSVHSLLDNGSSKKKCQQNCSSVFCLTLLLFYSDMVHKQ